jgi:hypothetical protein
MENPDAADLIGEGQDSQTTSDTPGNPERHAFIRNNSKPMTPRHAQRYISIGGGFGGIPDEATRRRAAHAARELGRALAKAGFTIIVYSADPKFIEPYVVEGYIASGGAKCPSGPLAATLAMSGTRCAPTLTL